jgi:hypothetical protein
MLKVYKLESEYDEHLKNSQKKDQLEDNEDESKEEESDEDGPLHSNFDIASKINCQGA